MRNEHLKTISGQEFGTTYPQKTWPCKGTVKVHEGLLTPLKEELNCATGQRDSLTIDSVRLGDEDVLLVAGELLVADHEGHPVAGIVEHLGEERLLPLQVEVLELHPDSAHTEVTWGQDTIYYKWASVKMTLEFHFLWSTLF